MEFLHAPFAALEQSGLALSIRNAHTLYPLANVAHVLGVVVFFALVAGMDMAVLRRSYEEAQATIRRTRPFALLAFAVIVGSGAIMFTAEAGALIRNPSFLAKMTAIAVAAINLLLFTRAARSMRIGAMRASALLSMLVWLFAAAAGRGIAYL
jgi:hypothetical protein